MNRRHVSLAVVTAGAALIVAGMALLAGLAWSLLVAGVAVVLAGLFLVDVA